MDERYRQSNGCLQDPRMGAAIQAQKQEAEMYAKAQACTQMPTPSGLGVVLADALQGVNELNARLSFAANRLGGSVPEGGKSGECEAYETSHLEMSQRICSALAQAHSELSRIERAL